MRESIGGTMLFWIVLFFMSIFITFMASVIRYARVYKIKNSMINYIERSEGIYSQEEFEAVLDSLGYPANGKYIVCKYNPIQTKGGYYYLKLYATFEFPIIGLDFDVSVTGESSQITTGTLINSNPTDGPGLFTASNKCKGYGVSSEELRIAEEKYVSSEGA